MYHKIKIIIATQLYRYCIVIVYWIIFLCCQLSAFTALYMCGLVWTDACKLHSENIMKLNDVINVTIKIGWIYCWCNSLMHDDKTSLLEFPTQYILSNTLLNLHLILCVIFYAGVQY